MLMRAARRADLETCVAIYNHYVTDSVATFDTRPMSRAAAQRWYDSHQSERHPLLVVENDGEVMGYGSLSRWSSKAAYGRTSEVSVFVSPDHQRKGAGAVLLGALIRAAEKAAHRCLIARIEARNIASIELFKAAGFHSVGVMHDAGFKFGRWLDVEIMEFIVESGAGIEEISA